MRIKSHRDVIAMLREQYESIVYRTLIESKIKEDEIMDAAWLEVTRKRDSKRGKKGEKLTIHSVERRDGQVIVKMISPENVPPISSTVLQSQVTNQPTQDYTLEEFESNFV